MLPHLIVRPAVERDRRGLDVLMASLGPACFCDLSCVSPLILTQTLVAVQAEQVVGFVAYVQDEMQAVVMALGVIHTHRRFGVASELLRMLIEHTRDEGLRLLEASVASDQTIAQRVFVKAEFRTLDLDLDGRIHFEKRLWGRRNRADGFS